MTCPHCGAVYVYPEESRLPDGKYTCQNCMKPFEPTDRVAVKISGENQPEDASAVSFVLLALIVVLVMIFMAPLIITLIGWH